MSAVCDVCSLGIIGLNGCITEDKTMKKKKAAMQQLKYVKPI